MFSIQNAIVKDRNRLIDFFVLSGLPNSISSLQSLCEAGSPGEILDIFPPAAEEELASLNSVPLFCFPGGLDLFPEEKDPIFFCFVLTDAYGQRLYGFNLCYSESVEIVHTPLRKKRSVSQSPFLTKRALTLSFKMKREKPKITKLRTSDSLAGEEHRENALRGYVLKSMCILSRFPFIDLFKSVLSHIYSCRKSENSSPLVTTAIDLLQVLSPPPGRIALRFTVLDSVFTCCLPAADEFPLVNFSLRPLFQCLSLQNILNLLLCMLLDKKIVFYSKHYSLLTLVAEGLSALLVPFRWRRVYIPVLPKKLLECTEAPTPYIMGMHRRFVGNLDLSQNEVVCVDIDFNEVYLPERLPQFPKHIKANLMSSLYPHIRPDISQIDNLFPMADPAREKHNQEQIRMSFLNFFAELFETYNFQNDVAKEEKNFLYRVPDVDKEFYEEIFKSDNWTMFVEERKVPCGDIYENFMTFISGFKAKKKGKRRNSMNIECGEHLTPSRLSYGSLSSSTSDPFLYLSLKFGYPTIKFTIPPLAKALDIARVRHATSSGTIKKEVLLFPDQFELALSKRQAYLHDFSATELIAICSTHITRSPEIVQYYFIRANLYAETGSYLKALVDYETMLGIMFGQSHFTNFAKENVFAIFEAIEDKLRFDSEFQKEARVGSFITSYMEEFMPEETPDTPRRKTTHSDTLVKGFLGLPQYLVPTFYPDNESFDPHSFPALSDDLDPNYGPNDTENAFHEDTENGEIDESSTDNTISSENNVRDGITHHDSDNEESGCGGRTDVRNDSSSCNNSGDESNQSVNNTVNNNITDVNNVNTDPNNTLHSYDANLTSVNTRKSVNNNNFVNIETPNSNSQHNSTQKNSTQEASNNENNNFKRKNRSNSTNTEERRKESAYGILEHSSSSISLFSSISKNFSSSPIPHIIYINFPSVHQLLTSPIITRKHFLHAVSSTSLILCENDANIIFDQIAKGDRASLKHVQKLIEAIQSSYRQSIEQGFDQELGEVVIRISKSNVTTSKGRRGLLILTNHRLLFKAKKGELEEFCKLNEIVGVSSFNFKIFIPPGLPCLQVTTEKKREIFCFVKWKPELTRDVWVDYLKELQGSYEIALDLNDPRFILYTSQRLVLMEVLYKLKKPTKKLLRFYNLVNESYYKIAQTLEGMNVLNAVFEFKGNKKEKPRHGCVIIEELLTSLIPLFFAHVQEDGRHVDFSALANTPEFEEFESATSELQLVDLDAMSSHHRLGFFINMFNVLCIHGYVKAGFPSSEMDWRYYSKAARYIVGGLPFSLDDIYHGILRGNKSGPWFSKKVFGVGDPRLPYVQKPDFRVHFALCFHCESSPCLRFYDPNHLNVLLDKVTEEYLGSHVVITDKQVQLPEILKWYTADTKQSRMFLGMIEPYLDQLGSAGRELFHESIYDSDIPIVYSPFNWSPCPKPFHQWMLL